MRKINVLILGVGGNVSQGIMAALKTSKLPCRIVGACISHESLGLFFCETSYIVPLANDPLFIDSVIDICNKENIDIILTGVEENIIALEINRAHFESRTKAVFVCSSIEQLEIGLNKYKTSEWLKNNNFNYPESACTLNWESVIELVDNIGFPLIAKPNSGKGSNGIFIVNNWQELETIKNSDYCVQEILGDSNSEYTVACYVDKEGRDHDILIMHRKLKAGTTFMAEIVQNELIRDECERICRAFKPIGPFNIQLRIHKGKPVCFEFNVRFSGTTPIRAQWGYNDVEALINEYIHNIPVSLHPLMKGKAYRYYNEAFIDVDMQQELKVKGKIDNVQNYYNFIGVK